MTPAAAIDFLDHCRDFLARQDDLSPANDGVNACLGRLVGVLSSWYGTPLFEALPRQAECADLCQTLPDLCARAEGEMEKWWARRILAESCPAMRALSSFWYMGQYQELCRDEAALLGRARTQQLAFLGSGALPLTALILAMEREDCTIRCIDCDPEACDLAEQLVKNLGLRRRITVTEQRAEDFTALKSETIVCASLLRAPGLFDRLAAQQVEDLLVRDAEGAYRFLYRPAPRPPGPYREAACTAPSATRINTSIHYRMIV